jgi:hypothetical protein
MNRVMAESVAAWEDDGGARRASPGARTVRRGRNLDQASRLIGEKPDASEHVIIRKDDLPGMPVSR